VNGRATSLAERAESRAMRLHLAACLFYHTAISVMLVVSTILIFNLEKESLVAGGMDAVQAGLRAGGIVFWLATITGAMRIPGAHFGGWLAGRLDQRTVASLSAASRAAALGGAAVLIAGGRMTLPLAAAIYSLDWFLGGLEEVARFSLPIAMVGANRRSVLKNWSTSVQGLTESAGVLGPSITLALTFWRADGFDRFGHWIAPALLVAATALYGALPSDAHLAGSAGGGKVRVDWRSRWRELSGDPFLSLPTLALALVVSIALLKGPLSTDLASIMLAKQGLEMRRYSALLSGIFGAGTLAGFLLLTFRARLKDRPASAALTWSGAATALLVVSWVFGVRPSIAFWPVAAAWFGFAMADIMARIPLNLALQHAVAAEGAGKKYVLGLAISLANVVVTAMRVLIGLIFFVIAGSWQLDFALVGGVLLLFAAGQIVLARRLAAKVESSAPAPALAPVSVR
jgi:hypothetical protein